MTWPEKTFCEECREMVGYSVVDEQYSYEVHGKTYAFLRKGALCDKCGNHVSPHGIFDYNSDWMMRQYREASTLAGKALGDGEG